MGIGTKVVVLASILFLSVIGTIQAAQAATINEIRMDQTGSDDDEYFELFSSSGESLDGLTYVVIGDGLSTQGSGVIEEAIDLTGNSILAGGYFLVAESSFDPILGSPDLTVAINFENVDNTTHLLVAGFTGAVGDDLDTDDDGVLDVTPWTSVMDDVALIEELNPPSGTEFYYSATTVGPQGSSPPSHVYRSPDGGSFFIGTQDISAFDTPGTTNPIVTDSDGDLIADPIDNCPNTFNTDQADFDGDGIGEACDQCPTDPNNTDNDADGFCVDLDCNDLDPSINPEVDEVCDNVDNNCDTQIDEGGVCQDSCIVQDDGTPCDDGLFCTGGDVCINQVCVGGFPVCDEGFACDEQTDSCIQSDSCGDGVCDPNIGEGAGTCEVDCVDADDDGFSVGGGDCNDLDPSINPEVDEVCDNNVDDNCNGLVDDVNFCGGGFCGDGFCDPTQESINICPEDCQDVNVDADGDGFETPEDCNDNDPEIFPGAQEVCGDNQDNDCNGLVDDFDVCGGGFCGDGTVNSGEQCDDGNNADGDGCSANCISELDSCGDNICDPDAGENANNCEVDCADVDVDGDGFVGAEDCDDLNPEVNPAADEVCDDNVDNDCDGQVDDVDVCGGGFCGDGVCDPNAEENQDSCPVDCVTTDTGVTTGRVEVVSVPTCGLVFLDGAPIQYGEVTPFALTSKQTLVLDNSGDTPGALFVRGGNWVDSLGASIILVHNTHYSTSSGDDYDFMRQLSATDTVVTENFDPIPELSTFWQMRANLEEPSFTGSLSQTMEFTISC